MCKIASYLRQGSCILLLLLLLVHFVHLNTFNFFELSIERERGRGESSLVGTMGERTFVSLEFVLCVCELRV
jgi:hypothetical protein